MFSRRASVSEAALTLNALQLLSGQIHGFESLVQKRSHGEKLLCCRVSTLAIQVTKDLSFDLNQLGITLFWIQNICI